MAIEDVSPIQVYAFAQFINEIVKQAYKQAYADIQEDIAKQAPRMYTRKEVAERFGSIPSHRSCTDEPRHTKAYPRRP